MKTLPTLAFMNKSNLNTKKYKPSSKLIDFIDTYWIIENQTSKTIDMPIVPDGCMDIIYQNNQLIFVAAMDEGIVVDVKPDDYSFGIRFKPAVFAHLLDQSCKHFTNKIIPLQELSIELYQLLDFIEKDEDKKVNTIFENLFKDIKLNQNIVLLINNVIEFKADITVGELTKSITISQRQLQRLCLYYLGYSIKRFCNIVRFFYIFKELIKTGTEDITSKAYKYGYCDQAHLNKEFKKFSNFSPNDKIMSLFYNTKK